MPSKERIEASPRGGAKSYTIGVAFFIMSHFVYILYSENLDKYYVGKTSNIENRLAYHNADVNRIWTKQGQPWVLKSKIELGDSTEATRVERFIKKQKNKTFILKIIQEGWNPESI